MKLKKVAIFAPAYAMLRMASAGKPAIIYWRNGRVVECGSLENC